MITSATFKNYPSSILEDKVYFVNQATVFVGHPGCGKTTLLKSLNLGRPIPNQLELEGETAWTEMFAYEPFRRELPMSDTAYGSVIEICEKLFGKSIALPKKEDEDTCSDKTIYMLCECNGSLHKMVQMVAQLTECIQISPNGMFLIDEIENGFHPNIQQKILKILTQTYPETQFVITTNSPFILAQTEGMSVVCIKNGKFYFKGESYAKNIHHISEKFFDY